MANAFKNMLLLALWLGFAMPGQGLELTSDTPVTPLISYAELYEDTEASITLEQAIQAHQSGLFHPFGIDDVSQGISGSAFWLRLEIFNDSSKPIQWVLFHRYGFTQLTDVYIFDPAEEDKGIVDYLVHFSIGEETPFEERPIRFRSIAVPAQLGAHESQVIYVRQGVNYANTQHLAWSIAPRLAFDNYVADNRSVHFFFYGIMAAFIIVAGMTAIRSRSLLLGLYSTYLFMASLSWAEMAGHLSEMVFPDNPIVSTQISNFVMFVTGGLMFELGRRFLRLSQNMPVMDRAFQVATVFCVAGIITAYLGMGAISTLFLYSLVFFMGIFPLIGVLIWRKGFGYVRWFVVGLCIHAVTLVMLGMAGAGVLNHAVVYYWISQFILVLEAAVFGLALAERVVDARRRTREEERAWREAQRHSDTDALTNLPNRRKFEQRLGNHLKTVEGARNTHLAVLDIDGFSEINAKWGHAAGDHVLCELAHLLQESVRSHDFVARYRGSRFVMLLTETNLDSALLVIDRIRGKFESNASQWEDAAEIQHTFSAGVATTNMNSTSALLLDEANRALALAKQGGKNKVLTLTEAA